MVHVGVAFYYGKKGNRQASCIPLVSQIHETFTQFYIYTAQIHNNFAIGYLQLSVKRRASRACFLTTKLLANCFMYLLSYYLLKLCYYIVDGYAVGDFLEIPFSTYHC